MNDRTSARHTQHAKTPQPAVRKIVHLRWKQRLGPVQIGARMGMPASTVHAVLVRCRLNRLPHIDRVTGEPARRYERSRPGELIHVDVTKFGNVPDGGGWRFVGKTQGDQNRLATKERTGQRDRHYGARVGTCFVHTVIDDYSRLAYAECHDDETAATAVAVLHRAVAWFADHGITVERVLSDNGSAYKSHLWRDTCQALDIKAKKTRPYRPQTNGKIERLHRTMSDAVGIQEALPLRRHPPSSPDRMAAPVQPPQAPLSPWWPPTHHPVGQPGWASQLDRAALPRATSSRRCLACSTRGGEPSRQPW
jgi:transposase InsO family protein